MTGWNYSMGATTNGLTAGFLFTQVLNEDHAVQFWEALESGNTGRAMRKKVSGGWQPWEWINPPMESGIEYRTTERHLGKPVYVKAVDFGALPNSGDKLVGITGNDNVIPIRCFGVLNNGVTIPGVDVNDTSTEYPIKCWAVYDAIWIAVPYDASHRTAVVTVWYTKTTD